MDPMLRPGTLLLLGGVAAFAQPSDVQSVFQKRCYVCHGPQQQMSNLRLDRKDSAMRVIAPGKSWRLVVKRKGAVPYVCAFHPMTGTLTVK